MVDVTNPDAPEVAHAVDTVLNNVSACKSIGSELEMDVLRRDRNHFNRIFTDCYQDENDSYAMKHVTYTNFYDDMDAIGNWSLLGFQNFEGADASDVFASAPSKFGDNCGMYAIWTIDLNRGDPFEYMTIDGMDWRRMLTVIDEFCEAVTGGDWSHFCRGSV